MIFKIQLANHLSLIRIRHSLVTDKYLAAEENQNQNWQYFIEHVIEVCKSREIGSKIQPAQEFLLTTVENVTLTKRVYNMVYKTIARNFYLTISKLSVDEQKEIKEDLLSKNFWWKDSLKGFDSWVACYYQHGRFPELDKFTNVPHVDMPIFLKTEMSLSRPDLHKKFAG